MPTQPKIRYTAEEYLALERAAEYKSEFYAGEIFAMAGASAHHGCGWPRHSSGSIVPDYLLIRRCASLEISPTKIWL